MELCLFHPNWGRSRWQHGRGRVSQRKFFATFFRGAAAGAVETERKSGVAVLPAQRPERLLRLRVASLVTERRGRISGRDGKAKKIQREASFRPGPPFLNSRFLCSPAKLFTDLMGSGAGGGKRPFAGE